MGPVFAAALLTACTSSGSGDLPSPSSSRTASATLPSVTATRTIEPPTPGDSQAPSPTSSAAAAPASTSSSTPSWVWWLIVALVVALAIAIPLIVRSRRRSAWHTALAGCEQEVAWFARVLIRELAQLPTADGAAGVWAAESGRISTLTDRLTTLEPTAPDDRGRARARILNDAVLRSQIRVDSLLAWGADPRPADALRSVAADLEAVLARSDATANGSGRHH